jgi:hypothetical protein
VKELGEARGGAFEIRGTRVGGKDAEDGGEGGFVVNVLGEAVGGGDAVEVLVRPKWAVSLRMGWEEGVEALGGEYQVCWPTWWPSRIMRWTRR